MTETTRQLALDFKPAPSRRTDPATSREAGRKHGASGTCARHKASVYSAVCDHPGLTSLELAPLCGLDRWETARRLSDLHNEGLLRQGEPKRLDGRAMVTWWRSEQ